MLGGIATAASVVNPLAIGSNPDAPPELAAYGQGVTNQLAGGLTQGVTRQAIDAVGGKEAGDRWARSRAC